MSIRQGAPGELLLFAPLCGRLMPIEEVPDPVFSRKMVGDGIAIDPLSEMLLAPCDGEIIMLHASGHALTLKNASGVEILMHIGLETVSLKGQGFTPQVRPGDRVETGQPLIAFDAAYLAEHAAGLLTMMLVANPASVTACHAQTSGTARGGRDVVLRLDLASGADVPPDAPADGPEVSSESIVIRNPAGLHARPASVLVNNARRFKARITLLKDGRAANAKSLTALIALEVKQHDRVMLKAAGPDAAEALKRLVPLIASGLGENLHAQASPEKTAEKPRRVTSADPDLLIGVPASPGLAVGALCRLRYNPIDPPENSDRPAEEERRALDEARARARGELAELQRRMRYKADAGKAAIFAAHQELLDDPALLDAAAEDIKRGRSAAFAWKKAYETQVRALRKVDNELLAARAHDVNDIGRRVLLRLVGNKENAPEYPPGCILAAEDLSPSDTALLDKSKVLGFCTTGGSATSHASILARSIGIPAVAAIDEKVLDLPDGLCVILDGDQGEVRVNPAQAEIGRVRELNEQAALKLRRELERAAQPALTLDGARIKVLGNIGGASEAGEVTAMGGEGVGLLRSEFLFLQRPQAPSRREQEEAYQAIAAALGPRRDLVVRTLDVGGDKPLAYLPMPDEANPFLGVRGIRLNLLDENLFREQIRSVLSCAALTRLHVMFPMVSDISELRAAKAMVLSEKKELGLEAEVRVGIMVEVPSAALLAGVFAAEADFFSIGTNDLTQYALAIDRGHPRLAALADPLHPAVLKLIDLTVRGAAVHGRWVGVCGALAGETLAVPALLGLGVSELSMAATAIPGVKAAVRRQRLEQCRELALELLELESAAQVRTRLKVHELETSAGEQP